MTGGAQEVGLRRVNPSEWRTAFREVAPDCIDFDRIDETLMPVACADAPLLEHPVNWLSARTSEVGTSTLGPPASLAGV